MTIFFKWDWKKPTTASIAHHHFLSCLKPYRHGPAKFMRIKTKSSASSHNLGHHNRRNEWSQQPLSCYNTQPHQFCLLKEALHGLVLDPWSDQFFIHPFRTSSVSHLQTKLVFWHFFKRERRSLFKYFRRHWWASRQSLSLWCRLQDIFLHIHNPRMWYRTTRSGLLQASDTRVGRQSPPVSKKHSC